MSAAGTSPAYPGSAAEPSEVFVKLNYILRMQVEALQGFRNELHAFTERLRGSLPNQEKQQQVDRPALAPMMAAGHLGEYEKLCRDLATVQLDTQMLMKILNHAG